jgi:transposase-like protein
MRRRKFSREFKFEAVKLVRDRGVSVAQAARDLDVHENVLRKWVRDQGADPGSAFPGHGVMRPEQQELIWPIQSARVERSSSRPARA